MRRPWFLFTCLVFGYAFLYVPIILLMIYSFNESRLVTIWGGFSTKWYGTLLENQQMLDAARRSLEIAAIAATVACVLGTVAGLVLARFGRFRGRTLFSGMVTAPLVMPEVITGLSLLLLFVAMEQLFGFPPGRGILTITIAHTTFCMAYVAVVVQSRLVSSRRVARGGGDGPRRHAAGRVLRHHAADHRPGAGRRLAAGLHAVAR